MKFKNIKTGNVVRTENPVTIDLMQKSDRYVAVSEKSGKRSASRGASKQESATE